MLFNSAIFLLFVSVVLPLYAVLRVSVGRKWMLLVASYAFYANWDYRYVVLLALSTLVDSVAGRRIYALESQARRRGWLLASLVTNLGILAVFKYGNFLIGNVDPLWQVLGVRTPTLPGEVPIGISFYTFQTMSYTIDVYRRRITPCRSALDFALYVSFFAQLVAGPIVRCDEFVPQVRKMQQLSVDRFVGGLQRFLLGLFKKMVIADNVGLFVDAVFQSPGDYGAIALWGGAMGFALQIYCDFSGYTDMALGIGRVFGIRLPENFNAPYLARSITEFWRRWHMSLSRWLRDYLYISLGGSRCSKRRTYVNLMLTMMLGGLWHGAAWTFVIWGAFHGVLLALERAFNIGRAYDSAARNTLLDWCRTVGTFALVCIGWVVFRAESFESMAVYLRRMFTEWTWLDRGELLGAAWVAALLALLGWQYCWRRWALREILWNRLPVPAQGLVMAAAIVLTALFRVDEVAFIYFQF